MGEELCNLLYLFINLIKKNLNLFQQIITTKGRKSKEELEERDWYIPLIIILET